VNKSNNKFYFAKDVEITIPKDSYEVRNINVFLKCTILRKHPRRDAPDAGDAAHTDNSNGDNDDNGEYPISLRAKKNTMRYKICL